MAWWVLVDTDEPGCPRRGPFEAESVEELERPMREAGYEPTDLGFRVEPATESEIEARLARRRDT